MFKNIEYPYTTEKELKALRSKKKEELVALVCYLSRRLGTTEEAVKRIMELPAEAQSGAEYFVSFAGAIRLLFMKTLTIMKSYKEFIKGLNVPNISAYEFNPDILKNGFLSDNSSEREHFDVKDITIQ